MCGLIGVFNSELNEVKNLDKFMEDGLIATQLRGTDATGMFQVTGQKILQSYKKALDGTSFASLVKTKRILEEATSAYVTVGHCRKATTGSILDHTAHPFMFDDAKGEETMAVVHNGTINVWDKKNFSTDTEFLAEQLYVEGARALDNLDGSFACMWTDMEEELNHIATNGQRPLYYAYVKDKNVMLVASEAPALAWLASRNSLELQEGNIYEFEKHMHYEFPIDNVRKVTKTAITPYKVPERPAYKGYETPKDRMLREMGELFQTPETAPFSLTDKEETNVSSFRYPTTPEEAQRLTAMLPKETSRVCKVMACFYDGPTGNAYFELDDGWETQLDLKALKTDCIAVMRNVTPEQWLEYENYEYLYATAIGLQPPHEKAAANFNTLVLAPVTNRQKFRSVLKGAADGAASVVH